ncbi:MAG: class I SAM-dependent methyltransferase, partial [Litorimonas sp.]
LNDVRAERSKVSEAFFAGVANDLGQLGNEYLPQSDIETALLKIVSNNTYDYMVDLGTGTGRMLELFSNRVTRGAGIDSNADMLTVARHKLASTNVTHISVQQGDLTSTPLGAGVADLVTLHQVLHYLDDPQEAFREASRLLMTGGTFLIIDFEAHQFETFRDKYAHRRLGFSDQEVEAWLLAVNMQLTSVQNINNADKALPAVKIWRAERVTQVNARSQKG